jgi:hypothetical protein
MAALALEFWQASKSTNSFPRFPSVEIAARVSKVFDSCRGRKVRAEIVVAGSPSEDCCLGKKEYNINPLKRKKYVSTLITDGI